MDNKEMVQRLLKGSENIDRMKSEIDSVVWLLIRLCMRKDRDTPRIIEDSFGTERYRWQVTGNTSDFLHVAYISNPGSPARMCLFHQTPTEGVYCDSLEAVQIVHEALPDLVSGMQRMFPGLSQRLQPYIKASDVFPR